LHCWIEDTEAAYAVYFAMQMFASDFNRFRMEEVPKHLKQKYRLTTLNEELKVIRSCHGRIILKSYTERRNWTLWLWRADQWPSKTSLLVSGWRVRERSHI